MISSQVIASYATNCVMDQNYESIDDLLKDMNETIKGMTSNMSDSDLSKNLNTPSDFLHNMLNPDEFKNKYKSWAPKHIFNCLIVLLNCNQWQGGRGSERKPECRGGGARIYI